MDQHLLTSHEEIDRKHFDTITPCYVRKDLRWASRLARRLRLEQTLSVVPAVDAVRVLEVGCGAGFSADYLANPQIDYVGIDYSENLIKYAKQHHARDQARFEVANARTYTCDQPFDVVFMIGVLHHFQDIDLIVRHLVTLLKRGGWFVANEPQPSNALIRVARKLRKSIDPSYTKEQAQLTAEQLRGVYSRAGLTEVVTKAQGFLSTPFAEVPLKPHVLAIPLSSCACLFDKILFSSGASVLAKLSWNVVAAGRKP